MVEVLKLLYFERKGNSSNINLAPYKEIQAAVEVLSNHQQISSTKFNLNYSELLVDMSVGLSFILNTTTFEAELNDKFYNATLMGDNSYYIVARWDRNIVIY